MKWLKRGAVALGMVVVALAAVPFLISLDAYIPHVERAASERLRETVTIQRLRASVFPTPRVAVDGITVGTAQEIKLGRVTVTPDLLSLIGTVKVIRSIDVQDVVLSEKALEKIPAWSRGRSGGPAEVRIRAIHLQGAVVHLRGVRLGPFDAQVTISESGEPQEAALTSRDGINATITPHGKDFRVNANATSWKLPLGPPILFDALSVNGRGTVSDLTFESISARLYGGTVAGNGALRWERGIQLAGRFTVNQVELKQLVPLLSPGNRMSGRLNAQPVLSAQASSAARVMDALRVETPFNVQNGVLYGIDIQKAATNLVTNEPTGGETRFDVLSGRLVMERGAYRFTQLKIASGALAASGDVSISPKKTLSGRITAEVKAANVASASVPLNVSGTVQSPLLLPTGGTVAGAAAGTAILGPGLGTSIGAKVGGWVEGLFGKEKPKQ